MVDFYKMAIPKCSKESIKKLLKQELSQAWHGIVDGDNGGTSLDWRKIVYYELYQGGWIEQTEHCKRTYGDFSKLK